MKILSRYLLKEVVMTFTAVMGVLSVIFLSHRFARYLAESAAGNLTGDVLFIIIGFNFITSLTIIVPIALYFSVFLALGRLYKDSEMIVLMACGISQWQILKPILVLGIALTLMVGFLSVMTTPWAISKIETLKWESKSISRFTGIQPGQFKTFESGQRVFYFQNFRDSDQTMENVMVFQRGKKHYSHFILAGSGTFVTDKQTGAVMMVLKNGAQYEGLPGKADFRITEFEENHLRLQKKGVSPGHLRKRAIATWTLMQSASKVFIAEWQWRFSIPLCTLILVLMAVPLSKTTPRQGRFSRIFLAIVISFTYYQIMGISRTWVEKGTVTPWIGMWWVHFMFLMATAYLYQTANGKSRRSRNGGKS